MNCCTGGNALDMIVKLIEEFARELHEVILTFLNCEKFFGRSVKNF